MTTDQSKEHPSTYIVQDRANLEEMERLEIQDKMFNAGMDGVLPEFDDPARLRRVLDVGCGTGAWLIETALAYPSIERLVGADISLKMVEYARTQAERLGLGERVQFQTMDALRVLEFPNAFFDLVNHRLAASWLRTWEWRKLLLEYQRVLQPLGTLRITEMNGIIENNSPALTQLGAISLEVFYRSGRLFTPDSDGLTGHLARLMDQHAFENIQTRLHSIVLRAGTEMGKHFYEDMARGYRVTLPFFQKWVHIPDNYQQIYEQALYEMQQPDFVATWRLLTAWGTKAGG
jgi:ubiquinone/menaquinone biosynthesis C-methylase UbiE